MVDGYVGMERRTGMQPEVVPSDEASSNPPHFKMFSTQVLDKIVGHLRMVVCPVRPILIAISVLAVATTVTLTSLVALALLTWPLAVGIAAGVVAISLIGMGIFLKLFQRPEADVEQSPKFLQYFRSKVSGEVIDKARGWARAAGIPDNLMSPICDAMADEKAGAIVYLPPAEAKTFAGRFVGSPTYYEKHFEDVNGGFFNDLLPLEGEDQGDDYYKRVIKGSSYTIRNGDKFFYNAVLFGDGDRGEFTSVSPNPESSEENAMPLRKENGHWFNGILRAILAKFSPEDPEHRMLREKALASFMGVDYAQGMGGVPAVAFADFLLNSLFPFAPEGARAGRMLSNICGWMDRRDHVEISDEGDVIFHGCTIWAGKTTQDFELNVGKPFIFSCIRARSSVSMDAETGKWVPKTTVEEAFLASRFSLKPHLAFGDR
jgi:hypothetical protein